MGDILKLWPLFVSLGAVAASWGSQQVQLSDLKEEVKGRAYMEAQQARIDERTKAILESQRKQEDMMKQLLDKVLNDGD